MEKRIEKRNDFYIVVEEKPTAPAGFSRYSDFHCFACTQDPSKLIDQVCLRQVLNALGLGRDDYVADAETRRTFIMDRLDPNDAEPTKYFCLEYFLSKRTT